MAVYEIVNVQSLVRDWASTKGGPMKSYRVDLKDEAGQVKSNVEWARKASSPAPTVGEKLDGVIESTDFGLKVKVAPSGGFGGGRGTYGKSPEERRSIAMQASHKVAIDCLKLAAEFGTGTEKYVPPSAADVVAQVKAIANGLFQQIEEVSK